nr:MAG TPA: hypothetical protein [Inoviridae sp.]
MSNQLRAENPLSFARITAARLVFLAAGISPFP